MRRRWLVKVVFLLLLASVFQSRLGAQEAQAAGNTYYVDATGGSDANSGLSEDAAWQSITKVRAAAFAPGDQVLFKRGERWNGVTLNMPSSGTAGAPIVFGAYGPSNLPKPIISGAAKETSWQGPGENGEYYKSGFPGGTNNSLASLMEDGVRLTGNGYLQTLPGGVKGSLAPGTWVWDSVTASVYYKPSSGTPNDHLVELSTFTGSYALNSNGKSYVEVHDLEFRGGYNYSVLIFNTSQGIVLQGNTIKGAGRFGIRLTNADNNSVIDNDIYDTGSSGVVIENGADSNLIAGNRIFGIGQLPSDDGNLIGIYVGADSGQARSAGNRLLNNEIYQIGKDWYKGKSGTTSTGLMYSMGIQIESVSDTQVVNNKLHDVWRSGVSVFTSNADARNTFIAGNLIYHAGKMSEVNQINSGIYLNNSKGRIDGSRIVNNTLADNNFQSAANREAGIYIKAHSTATVTGASAAFSDVTVSNNLIAGTVGNYALTYEFEPGVTVSSFVSDYNLLRPESDGGVYSREGSSVTIYDAAHIVGSTSAYYSFARNRDMHSVTGNPQFVDATGGDYHIADNSAAKDVGVPVGISSDLDGNPVPVGPLPDIGAYENQTVPVTDTIPPIVTGVAEGGNYSTVITVTYNEGTAVLSHNGGSAVPFLSGSTIVEQGSYTLVVTDLADNQTTVHFTITFVPVPIAGVVDGGSYSRDVMPIFASGIGALSRNGGAPTAFVSGTGITAEGSYVLTVTDSVYLPATVHFLIDKTPPIITGASEGGVYEGSVTPQFNEETGMLTQFVTQYIEETRTGYAFETTAYNGQAGIGEVLEQIDNVGTETTSTLEQTSETLVNAAFLTGTPITEPGSYKLTVTDNVYLSTSVRFEVVPIPVTAVTLTGPASTVQGGDFQLTIGVQHVAQQAGLDVRLEYDPSQFDYVSVDSVKAHTTIAMVQANEVTGVLRIAAANLEPAYFVTGNADYMQVTFRAKTLSAPSSGEFRISSAVGTNGLGELTQLALATHEVTASRTVDKSSLQSGIATAVTMRDQAAGGVQTGNFFPDRLTALKAALQTAITLAQTVDGDGGATQAAVDAAAAQLADAAAIFEANRITATTGDLNGNLHPGYDIGDLGIVANYFWLNSASPNWAQAQVADVNRDGVVDFVDLAFIAQRL